MSTRNRARLAGALLVALGCILASQIPLEAQQDPVNPNASAKTREVLRLLYDLPNRPDKKVISGQILHVFNGGGWQFPGTGDVNPDIYNRVSDIFNQTGKWVGIAGAEYTSWYPGDDCMAPWLNASLIEHSRKGGIVSLHWHPRSPTQQPPTSYQQPWDNWFVGGVTADMVLNPGPAHDQWMRDLDAAAVGLKELRDNDVVVLWRPMHARDAGWWWGLPNMSQADYRRLWAHMVDYFSNVKGLNNLLYVQSWYYAHYDSATMDRLYAGSSNVDIVAVDHAEDSRAYDPGLENRNLLAFGKPIGISQGNPSGGTDPDWFRNRDADNFGEIQYIRTWFPRCTFFINFDYDHDYSFIDSSRWDIAGNLNARALLADSWVINAGEIFSSGGSYTLAATPSAVAPGDTITVSWTAPSGDNRANDWIGLYPSGAPNTSPVDRAYTGGTTSGNLLFTAPTAAGGYEFRYLKNDGYTSVASSNAVTVTGGGPPPPPPPPPGGSYTLAANPSAVTPGGAITVSWTTPTGKGLPTDWIGLYAVGSVDTNYLDYQPATGADSGSVTFAAPLSNGTYEFRYFLNGGYTLGATSNAVTVGTGGGGDLGGYWKLDDGSGLTATDSSGNGNHGTLVNGPTWTPGRFGSALSFNGANADVDAGSGPSLRDLGPLTVAAWIKPNSGGALSLGRIVAKENGGPGRWMLIFDGNLDLAFAKDYSTRELRRTSLPNAVALGAWQHVAATWDGGASAGNAHLYVNGMETPYALTQDGLGSQMSDGSIPLLIGNRAALDRGFDGIIDDVRVYNRALSPAEIQALSSGGGGGPPPSLGGTGPSSSGTSSGCGASGMETLLVLGLLRLLRRPKR